MSILILTGTVVHLPSPKVSLIVACLNKKLLSRASVLLLLNCYSSSIEQLLSNFLIGYRVGFGIRKRIKIKNESLKSSRSHCPLAKRVRNPCAYPVNLEKAYETASMELCLMDSKEKSFLYMGYAR